MDRIKNLKMKGLKLLLCYYSGSERLKGGPKEIGAFGGCYWVVRKDWEGLVQREGVGGYDVPNEAGREVGA